MTCGTLKGIPTKRNAFEIQNISNILEHFNLDINLFTKIFLDSTFYKATNVNQRASTLRPQSTSSMRDVSSSPSNGGMSSVGAELGSSVVRSSSSIPAMIRNTLQIHVFMHVYTSNLSHVMSCKFYLIHICADLSRV